MQRTGVDKQVRVLAQDDGHFSMIRALHLADAVTALNGSSFFHPPSLYTLALGQNTTTKEQQQQQASAA